MALVPDYEGRVEVMRAAGIDRAVFLQKVYFPVLKYLGITRHEMLRAGQKIEIGRRASRSPADRRAAPTSRALKVTRAGGLRSFERGASGGSGSFEREHAVVATEARAIGNGVANIGAPRFAHQIDLERGIELVDVDRRVQPLIAQRADDRDRLGGTGSAQQMPDHRLGGRDGNSAQGFAEDMLHATGIRRHLPEGSRSRAD